MLHLRDRGPTCRRHLRPQYERSARQTGGPARQGDPRAQSRRPPQLGDITQRRPAEDRSRAGALEPETWSEGHSSGGVRRPRRTAELSALCRSRRYGIALRQAEGRREFCLSRRGIERWGHWGSDESSAADCGKVGRAFEPDYQAQKPDLHLVAAAQFIAHGAFQTGHRLVCFQIKHRIGLLLELLEDLTDFLLLFLFGDF